MTTQDRPQYEAMLETAVNSRLSRRGLLRSAMLAGAGVAAIRITGPVLAQAATAQTDATPMSPFKNDVEVLNYALTLEHLETAFYRDGLKAIGSAGISALGFQSSVFDWLNEIAAHEAAHVATLTGVVKNLGGTPVAEATYDFGYTDAAGFLATAMAIEDTGVSAYGGAAQYLMDNGDLLTAALSIHGVEARHASYLAVLTGKDPFPNAFNPALTPAQVLDIAKPLIKS